MLASCSGSYHYDFHIKNEQGRPVSNAIIQPITLYSPAYAYNISYGIPFTPYLLYQGTKDFNTLINYEKKRSNNDGRVSGRINLYKKEHHVLLITAPGYVPTICCVDQKSDVTLYRHLQSSNTNFLYDFGADPMRKYFLERLGHHNITMVICKNKDILAFLHRWREDYTPPDNTKKRLTSCRHK